MALTTIDDRGLKTPIDLLDNEKTRFGTGNDLEIYHDGTNSFVYNTTGGLYLKSTNNAYIQVADGEEALRATANGATELKYDNTTKLQTTSTGTTTTGNATITGHIYQGDSDVHYFGAGPDLAIWHSGSHGFIRNTEGNLYIYSADGHDGHVVIQATYGEESVICEDNGAVKLYYDTLRSLKPQVVVLTSLAMFIVTLITVVFTLVLVVIIKSDVLLTEP